MLAVAILVGGTVADAKTTRKKPKATTSQGYRVENGKIIPTGSKPIVVDFYADWCGPCKQYAPNFDYVKSRYSSKATFIRINIDNNPQIANFYRINSIPTTMIILGRGNECHTINGYMDTSQLENFIYTYIR